MSEGTLSGGVYVQTNESENAVVAFERVDDGSLERLGAFASGGAGDGVAHLTSQGSVTLTADGRHLLGAFEIAAGGLLGEMRVQASPGPTPYGFALTNEGVLIVTEAFRAGKGEAAASSYAIGGGSITPVTRSVGNGRSEICWAVVSKDQRYVFTTNFADGAVSRYAIGSDTISLEDAVAGITVDGQPGLRDEDLSADGRYLYAIDADQGRIIGWSVGEGGSLSSIGSWGGLPPTVAGPAAR